MSISENGVPLLTGRGIEAVKKIMEQRFAQARQTGETSIVPSKRKPTSKLCMRGEEVASRPRRELIEIAAPILRSAERHFANAPIHHPRRQEAYVLVETAVLDLNRLFQEALLAIAHVPIKKDSRHEVVE